MTGSWAKPAIAALILLGSVAFASAQTLITGEVNSIMAVNDRGKERVKDDPPVARRVPGGWKLPGDKTVYPYDPTVPSDQDSPVPKPPSRRQVR